MNQTRLESLVETLLNIGSGYLVALFIQAIMVKIYDLPLSTADNMLITGIFTVASILRSYFWRRFFANGLHRWVHGRLFSILNVKVGVFDGTLDP